MRWDQHHLTLKFSYYTHRPQPPARLAAHAPTDAAVLLPLYEGQAGLELLFTVRARHLRHHPGQISFPGGKFETADGSLATTALRETEEEIGLPKQSVNVIGHLPALHTNSGFRLTPYIGFISPHPPLHINTQEVDEVFRAPLDYFLQPQNHLHQRVKHRNIHHDVYFMPWKTRNVWGATASILHTLYEHLK